MEQATQTKPCGSGVLVEENPQQQWGLTTEEAGGVDQTRIGRFRYDRYSNTGTWSPGVNRF